MSDSPQVRGGTRRPDGTFRKERVIRAGYVPQDEQPVYMSKGALARQDVPICPGFEPEAIKAASLTKNQKKNEKRKEHKKTGDAKPHQSQQAPDDVGAVTNGMQHLSTGAPPAQSKAESSPAPILAPTNDTAAAQQSPAERLHKDHRNLMKKIRQAEGLAEKQKLGQSLTKEEMEKVGKLPGWNTEAQKLEQELQHLSA